MNKERRGYISYLLRLWQIRNASDLVWRVSLESPHTDERVGFASLDELFAFLRQRTGAVPNTTKDQDAGQQRGDGDVTIE